MAGLMDWIKTPEGQGLLSAAFAGMAGAQRGTPWNNAGRAGVAGLMGYNKALESQATAGDSEKFLSLLRPKVEMVEQQGPVQDGMTLPKIEKRTQADPYAAYAFAVGSRSPELQRAGLTGLSMLPQLEATREEKALTRQQRMEEMTQRQSFEEKQAAERLQAQKDMAAERLATQKMIAEMNVQGRRDLAGIAGAIKGGKAEKPENWKYDAGSDTWVKPPTEDFPMGRSTPNVGKVQAFKNMEYLSGQLLGEEGKNNGLIDKATQGGVMGISGMAGRVFNSQAAREMDNAREQLSTELRKVFRIPGEGALSDREQAQYGLQLPDVKNKPELNRKIVNDILVRSRNSVLPPNNPMTPASGMPSMDAIDAEIRRRQGGR